MHAVVDEGSFAKAAQVLHKSQSSISYTIAKLQDMLGVPLLYQEGRRAKLTEHGLRVVNLSRKIVNMAHNVEHIAQNVTLQYEKSLVLAIDELFPTDVLMDILSQFAQENKQTRIILHQGILSGPSELFLQGEADLAVVSKVPEGYCADKLFESQSLPYAHINSPLHQKKITVDDLSKERYIIAQDSGKKASRNEGWLDSEFYWKVSTLEMKIQCIVHGIGFSWLPRQLVEGRNLPIKPLQLEQDDMRTYPLYLVYRDLHEIGPGAHLLIELFRAWARAMRKKAT